VRDLPIVDRALGCLLGLAIGDAVGTTLEFEERDRCPPIVDMVGGGPFGLEPGQWTDDTSMALCLAESLIAKDELDPDDLMRRFVRWWRQGENSVTGRCFDIGITTREALVRFVEDGNPQAGSTDPDTAGNGSIMRLAPVVLRWHNDAEYAVAAASLQGRTTHAAPQAVAGCRLLADLLLDAIATGDKAEALKTRRSDDPTVDRVAQGSWKGKSRAAVRSDGYVVHTLEAALWSVDRTGSFEEAVLTAANLAGDADTVAAVAGQIAGAVYGKSAIPQGWLRRLAWCERIEEVGRGLVSRAMQR
jgi:ADP-ribosyl-[dinitrogen reductase] hydrolase